MNHYIYIVHPIRFLEQNEPTYKIGKTTTNILDYISKVYSKSSKLIFVSEVINCHQLEKDIINLFDKIFVKRKDAGLEYYTGNVDKMKVLIASLMINEKVIANASNELPKVKQYVKNKQEYVKTLLETKVDDFDELDESDKLAEFNELNEPVDNKTVNINIQISGNSKKSLRDFYKYIYDTRPEWYIEKRKVDIDVIENAYRMYFDDHVTTKSIISRQLNGNIFNPAGNSKRTSKKIMVSYDELQKLINEM